MLYILFTKTFFSIADSQVVPHLLRPARLGGVAARVPRDPAPAAPPHPSRRPPRNLFLHNDRLAELAFGEIALLEHIGGGY